MAQNYSQIIKKLGLERVKQNELLAKHTTFKIGGPADLFYEAKTTKELIEVIKLIKRLRIPYFIIGGGSNLLIADEGFRGMVIKVQSSKFSRRAGSRFAGKVQSEKIISDAGVSLGELVKVAAKNSLVGLEFAAGIPGTVGGAVRGNAGAWQQSISDKVLRVKVLTSKGETKWLKAGDCQFGYRQSRFKKSGEIILEVELELEKGDKKEIKRKITENLEKRKLQPKEPSAGCVFVNPAQRLPFASSTCSPHGGAYTGQVLTRLSAGQMIEKCGLKGKRIGDAQISPQHANFIINLGKAKAMEVIKLIKLIKKKIKDKFGITLKKEIYLLGFDRIRQGGKYG